MPDKDILLLDPTTGKPVCRKEVSTLVDQSSIIGNSDAATPFRVNYPVVAGELAGSGVAANAGKLDAALVHNATGTTANATSGAGTTASPLTARQATDALTGVVELTGSAQMPAEKTRDDSALTPAGAAKLVGYLKPVASTGALNAEQLSADAIEVPMFSNFSCTGGTGGAPKWTMPVAGGGTCDIDLGAYSRGVEPYPAGTVLFSGSSSACLGDTLPPGVYLVKQYGYPVAIDECYWVKRRDRILPALSDRYVPRPVRCASTSADYSTDGNGDLVQSRGIVETSGLGSTVAAGSPPAGAIYKISFYCSLATLDAGLIPYANTKITGLPSLIGTTR